jgi:thiamine biosynthesis lipoprotein
MVVHDDPLAADVLSTALFVMGPDLGRQWAEAHGVAALFLIQTPAGLVVRTSTGLDRTAGVVIGG